LAKVSQDGQTGLQDEPIGDRETQQAIRDWFAADKAARDARASALLKDRADAADKARDLLPKMDDGEEHRFTFIDEMTDRPVQYVVQTRPGPDDKDVSFTRRSRPRMTVDQRESPRE
jgi:hypothetical protein